MIPPLLFDLRKEGTEESTPAATQTNITSSVRSASSAVMTVGVVWCGVSD